MQQHDLGQPLPPVKPRWDLIGKLALLESSDVGSVGDQCCIRNMSQKQIDSNYNLVVRGNNGKAEDRDGVGCANVEELVWDVRGLDLL